MNNQSPNIHSNQTVWYPTKENVIDFITLEEGEKLFANCEKDTINIILREKDEYNEKYSIDTIDTIESTEGKIVLIFSYDVSYIQKNLEKIRQRLSRNSICLGILHEFWNWDCYSWCFRHEFCIDKNYVVLSYLYPDLNDVYKLDLLTDIEIPYDLSDNWFNYIIQQYLEGQNSVEIKHWKINYIKKIIHRFVLLDFSLHKAKKLFAECTFGEENKEELLLLDITSLMPPDQSNACNEIIYRYNDEKYDVFDELYKIRDEATKMKIEYCEKSEKTKLDELFKLRDEVYFNKFQNLFTHTKLNDYINKYQTYLKLFKFCNIKMQIQIQSINQEYSFLDYKRTYYVKNKY